MKSLVLLCLFNLLCYSESLKILVVYPLSIRSLNIFGRGVVRHLLNDGHEVTFITTIPVENPPKNLRQIDISGNTFFDGDFATSISYRLKNGLTNNDHSELQDMILHNAKITLENENVTKFLANPNEHFDVVIGDYCETEVFAAFSVLYNCPMIWVYPLGAHWQVLRLIADTGNPAYDADYMGYNVPPFTFSQRVQELWTRITYIYIKKYISVPIARDMYERIFGSLLAKKGRTLPDYEDIIYNASMIFSGEHEANNFRPSTPQNFKYIGGFHVADTVKPLPRDLQELMNNAPHGVIYFSMGTLWKSSKIPMKLTKELLNVFGELKETVLWKYETDLEVLPKNVHTVKWAPQQSILAHPNLKLFITHGGMLSSIESIHFGVPVIGIPVYYDQFINVQRAVALKYALKVDLNYDLPKNLKAAINVMLSDDSYRWRIKELSSIYHDTPVKPGKLLTHWVRHVVRTRGALHLRSPARDVPFYQLLYLDLAALIIAILFVVYLSFRRILKEIINYNNGFEKKKKY